MVVFPYQLLSHVTYKKFLVVLSARVCGIEMISVCFQFGGVPVPHHKRSHLLEMHVGQDWHSLMWL